MQHCLGVSTFKLGFDGMKCCKRWPEGGEHRAKDKGMLGLLPHNERAVHFTLWSAFQV